MGRAIVITSGKGGVGKTTTTANLGAALAALGHSVVLVDADIGLRNLDVVMGLENRIVYHSVDVVRGKCAVAKALIKDRRMENLWLLPASRWAEYKLPPQMLQRGINHQQDWIRACKGGAPGVSQFPVAAKRSIITSPAAATAVRSGRQSGSIVICSAALAAKMKTTG